VLKHVIWLRNNKIIEETNQDCIFWYEIQLIQSLIIKKNKVLSWYRENKSRLMREYLRTNHLFPFTSEGGGNGLTKNYS